MSDTEGMTEHDAGDTKALWQMRATNAEAERDRLQERLIEVARDRDRLSELREQLHGDVARMGRKLRDAKAERDRLRAEKVHLVEINAALRTRPDLAERAPLVVALVDERDRLRAVVDAAIEVRRLRDASREVDEPADWDDEDEVREMSRRLASATVATSDALDVLSDRLDQLDIGDVMGGSTDG